MPNQPSRRELLMGGIAASVSLSTILNQPEPQPAQPDETPSELLKRAVKANANNAEFRLKFRLPENTEPCFTYIPEPREVRKR